MGAGKSFLLSQMQNSNLRHLDMDEDIAAQNSVPAVNQLIEMYGWDFFRRLEREYLDNLVRQEKFIVALGGGAVRSETMNELKKHVTLVWLDTPFEICYQRILDSERPLRPLSKEELLKLYLERSNFYIQADIRLDLVTINRIKKADDLINMIRLNASNE